MTVYEASVTLPAPRTDVFEFLRRPDNILKMFPSASKEKLSLIAPDMLNVGDLIEFNIKAIGQSFDFMHEITKVSVPEHTSSRQLKGLFQSWTYDQYFDEDVNNSTLLKTVISFEPPAGLLGFVVTKKQILSHLRQWIPYGHEILRKHLADRRV